MSLYLTASLSSFIHYKKGAIVDSQPNPPSENGQTTVLLWVLIIAIFSKIYQFPLEKLAGHYEGIFDQFVHCDS